MPRFLALDWDQGQLLVVAGMVAGGKVTVQRALAWREEQSPLSTDPEALGKRLHERLKEAGVAAAPVLACLGRDRVILKDLRYPAVPEAEEAALVRFQAVKELTDAQEDVVIDYTASGEPGGERRALALIVRNDVVAAYRKMCQAAGLRLAALTPRSFGLAACLRRALVAAPLPPETEGGAVAVVAIGEKWAEFCVLHGPNLLLARGLTPGPGLAGEIRRNLSVFAGQTGRPPVRGLYLAGAGSELRERIGDLVELPLQAFDPLAGAAGVEIPAEARGGFAGAVGLLYAKSESRGLPINFIQPRQPKAPSDPGKRRTWLIAAVAAVAAVVVAGVLWVIIASAAGQVQRRDIEKAQLDQDLAEVRKESKLYKALDDWDNVAILDELYDLTARVPDVNLLRISQVTLDPVARTAKTNYTARLTLKGTLIDNVQSRVVLDKLVAAFLHDNFYSPEAPKVVGNQFTLVVNVERRPPTEYKAVLPSVPDSKPDELGDQP